MVFSSRDYGTTAQILDGPSVRATKKSSSPVVLDFPSSISAILFFVLHSVNGADGDPKGVGIFPTKNAFLLFDITFYFDGAGKESLLLQVACLAWRCLGLFSSRVSFLCCCCLLLLAFPLPTITKTVHSISHAGRERLKERKGTIKHHSGTGRISNKFEKRDCSILDSFLLLPCSLVASSLYT